MAIQEYLSLITSEHALQPNYIAWLTAALDKPDDINSLLSNMYNYFDLDQAIGAQLDTIGALVGCNRTVNFQPSGGVSPVLDDETYKLIIKAKIARNAWDGTNGGIVDIWDDTLPEISLVIEDNQDMTITAVVSGITSTLQQNLVANGYIIPKPMGVGFGYQFITGGSSTIYYGIAVSEGTFEVLTQIA